jgi:hypothetical protein
MKGKNHLVSIESTDTIDCQKACGKHLSVTSVKLSEVFHKIGITIYLLWGPNTIKLIIVNSQVIMYLIAAELY